MTLLTRRALPAIHRPLTDSFSRLRDACDFWSFDTRVGARSFFDRWRRSALATNLAPIKKVAAMFLDHLTGLLSYAVHKVSNAVTKGFNSKIQMIKSAARGFRSFENYRIAILFHCGKLDLYPQ